MRRPRTRESHESGETYGGGAVHRPPARLRFAGSKSFGLAVESAHRPPQEPVLISQSEWDKAVAAVESAGSLAVCCHVNPDGDALGAMLGLGLGLRRRGKKVWMGWGSEKLRVPAQYGFLPHLDELTPPDQMPPDLDAFIAVDCGDEKRLELLRDRFASAKVKINIDHHLSNPCFGDINLVDATAASSAEVAYEFMKRMGETPDTDEATCFYTGIVTDTGRFQYSSTSAQTLRDAAELRELGVDHGLVAEQVFETAPFTYLHALGTILTRAKLDEEVVWTWMTPPDLGELPIEETEGFIDTLKIVNEAKVAALLKQQDEGEWKVSLRSRGRVDVSAIAQSFGGGGHARAAGFTRKGTLEQVASEIKEAVKNA